MTTSDHIASNTEKTKIQEAFSSNIEQLIERVRCIAILLADDGAMEVEKQVGFLTSRARFELADSAHDFLIEVDALISQERRSLRNQSGSKTER